MKTLARAHFQLLAALKAHPTVSEAAEALAITQSAASQRLKEAERRLDLALVVRHGKSVSLTPAGTHLAKSAVEAEDLLSRAEAEAQWMALGAQKKVRMVVSSYDHLPWTPGLAAHLQQKNAGQLEVINVPLGEERTALLSGRADFAVLPNRASTSQISAVHLFSDKLVCCLPQESPLADYGAISPPDITDMPYLTYSTMPDAGFEFDGFFRPSQSVPREVIQIGNVSSIVAMISKGVGLSILSKWAVSGLNDQFRVVLRSLDPSPPDLTWSMLTRHDCDDDLQETLKLVATWLKAGLYV